MIRTRLSYKQRGYGPPQLSNFGALPYTFSTFCPRVVETGKLEFPTSRLSVAYSNQLNYVSIFYLPFRGIRVRSLRRFSLPLSTPVTSIWCGFLTSRVMTPLLASAYGLETQENFEISPCRLTACCSASELLSHILWHSCLALNEFSHLGSLPFI